MEVARCKMVDHTTPIPPPAQGRSSPTSLPQSLAPQSSASVPGSMPLTPPLSPGPQGESKSSPDTPTSHQSRQEYLDSLQPPSQEEFERLSKLQEQREKEHKCRDQELRRQSLAIARQSMEARQDFMQTKAAEEQEKEKSGRRHSIFRHRKSHSKSRSRPNSKDSAVHNGGADAAEDSIRSKAATVIQRTYRGYRVRREMQGLGLDASTRWTHAIRDARWKDLNTPRARQNSRLSDGGEGQRRSSSSRSAARQNWMKVATIARRAGGDEDSNHSEHNSSSSLDDEDLQGLSEEKKAEIKRKRLKAQAKRRKHAQMMGLQYFLEMVDLKHRYGSNLRAYHEEWKKSDTNENFFYWLDYGGGKEIELAACPRERLDREQVRYLSREERQYYLVRVDFEGRLVWAKNGMRIDTTEKWKDSIHGVVPADDPTPAFAPNVESHIQAKPNVDSPPVPHDHDASSPDSSSMSSRESRLEAAMAAKYADTGFDNAKGVKKIRHVSAATIFNKLLRKTVRKNTWIFVADTSFRLYVGIKNSGAFQHSSFLQGARISAAGLIKIKNGRLSSLSPLSGHYRPPASNFRAFVHSLEDEGVDMSHVSISKSYAVLVGLEAYVKTKKKGKEAMQKLTHKKQKILDPEAARKREQAALDTSKSAALERKVLEKEREKEEVRRVENKATFKFMQKLGFHPRTPAGQTNGEPANDLGGH